MIFVTRPNGGFCAFIRFCNIKKRESVILPSLIIVPLCAFRSRFAHLLFFSLKNYFLLSVRASPRLVQYRF